MTLPLGGRRKIITQLASRGFWSWVSQQQPQKPASLCFGTSKTGGGGEDAQRTLSEINLSHKNTDLHDLYLQNTPCSLTEYRRRRKKNCYVTTLTYLGYLCHLGMRGC